MTPPSATEPPVPEPPVPEPPVPEPMSGATQPESSQPGPTPPQRTGPRRYAGQSLHVTFDAARCIHAAECVRGLPTVFDTKRRPWILPDAAAADAVAGVIARCPTGALHFERVDGGPAEPVPAKNTVHIRRNGPYYVRGKLTVVTPDGAIVADDMRMALCRCGLSQHKPFCDNAHIEAGFADPGLLAPGDTGSVIDAVTDPGAEHGPLTIKTRTDGPLKVEGDFELIGADKQHVQCRSEAALCRCGGSASKPFCDGTHKTINFRA